MNLDSLFSPTSVAILGASNKDGSVGNAVMTNILRGHFTGTVYPVNPSGNEVLGLKCYKSILDISTPVDLAVIITPSKTIPKVMEECGKNGVKSALIISAGFKETGEEGQLLEEQVKEIAMKRGIRFIGPNCVGMINADSKISLNATFTKGMPKYGNIALVSQSGAICSAMLEYARSRNIGFSKVFSLGNKADIEENDILNMLATDKATKVILMYIEDLADGRKFIEIASNITGEAEERKPILALKVGGSPIGARAISSHTGALAGSEEAYNAIFTQAGVLRVETTEELFDYAIAFANQPIPSEGTAVITNAGGPGVIVADAAAKYKLKLAKLSENTVSELAKILPKTASLINPIDIIGDADHLRYEKALRIVLRDANVNSCIVLATPQLMLNMQALAETIVKINKEFREKTLLSTIMGIAWTEDALKIIEQNNIPQYPFPESAVRVLSTMHRYRSWVTRPRTQIRVFDVDKAEVRDVFTNVKRQGRNYVQESEAMRVLKAYGFLVPRSMVATSEVDCVRISEEIGYPVVLKISSPDIVHKVDVGGVELNLRNTQEVKDAFQGIMQNVRRTRPDAKIIGINVQEFIKKGRETIIGMKRDKHFGPLLMFGLGGIYVGIFKDVSFRLAPIKELGAYRMIESTKASKILSGVRGEKPSDMKSIVECLERLSQLVTDFPEIEELDVNPLLVFEEGMGCKAVDARIVIS
ncbi:MAG: acetate--CoA ligase family protein [Nitrososphaerales archaeon]